MEEKLNSTAAFDISEHLNLSEIKFPKFPQNAIVSEEVNNFLRDQLVQMKRENEIFQQELSAKDIQIQRGQRKIDDLNNQAATCVGSYKNEFTSASQLASMKIKELSKKLREKNAEIEVYKSRCAKQGQELLEFKTKEEVTEKSDKKEISVNEPDEVKRVQDKLTFITNKWTEEKNLNLQLKNDLKRANKWLVQEVGEKFETLLTLNNGNSNWRGRAQIICDLQQKNYELKEKLKVYQDNNKDNSTMSLELTQTKQNKKLELLHSENSELRISYSDLKRKFETLKARCKALENEYISLKTKLTTLSEVHETDQQTIAKLTSQVSHYNELKNQDLKQKDLLIRSLQQENEALQVELAKEKCVSENKTKELLEKNDDIQLLSKRIRSARPTSSYVHRSENSDTKVFNKLEVERLRLLELTEVQNNRLQEERNFHFKTQELLRNEKQKCAKLEANLARLQLECNSSRSGYSNRTSILKQTELDIRDKLELAQENIKALNTRLEIECMERKRDLQEFRNILKNYNCG